MQLAEGYQLAYLEEHGAVVCVAGFRVGYFGGMRLSGDDPRLYLVAPALRVHPATEVVLKYFSRRVDWTLVALDERWRDKVKVVWRKRSSASA